jgi:hypothetical protein
LQGGLIEANLALDPIQAFIGPVLFDILRRQAAVAQQELSQTLAGALLILASVFARAHQIAQGLMIGIGSPHRRQIAGTITARQLHGVASIGLDTISRLDRIKLGATTSRATPSAVSCQYST